MRKHFELNNNVNTLKTNSIYDEYKSKTSYVIKVPIHDKEKIFHQQIIKIMTCKQLLNLID